MNDNTIRNLLITFKLKNSGIFFQVKLNYMTTSCIMLLQNIQQ
jgi:hypothetical protein